MIRLVESWQRLAAALAASGEWVALLPLRLLLAWEFWESGVIKLHGENWFGDIVDKFPFPFNVLPVDVLRANGQRPAISSSACTGR